jgi:hypothetical protein
MVHKAASAIFGRAADTASQFSHYTEGVAAALSKGAGSIGGARTALLTHADEVDHRRTVRLGPDGSAMRDLVRFYWQHPDSRGELTDGRALERLADERFGAGS